MKTLLIFAAILSGALMPVQAGINNLLRHWAQHTVLAATISFAVGTVALAAYVLVLRIPWPAGALEQTRIWHWSGGLLGAFFVTMSIDLAPRLGAGAMMALIILGQLLGGLLLDHYGLLGFPLRAVTWEKLLGVALVLGGVLLVHREW